ncbi:MAG TPA: site-2 protease family protein [Candidatus Babeliales bacterium]|nr:site-2 protease family protein [Candidatus Babeliales bacterium]
MNSIHGNGTIKNILYSIGGLVGINLIIFIHEMGHFMCAKLFQVPALSFSLGFGPALYECTIANTLFKLSLLPFGGYVELDPQALAASSYLAQMIILGAGIIFNLVFAYIILMYYHMRSTLSSEHNLSLTTTIKTMGQEVSHLVSENKKQQSSLLGPIGIIALIGKCLAINPRLYWFILAILSLNIALFNMLPLPFFDGGKALLITLETLGLTIPSPIIWLISTIMLALLILFVARITLNDVKRLFLK